jgi:rRNA maturation endonuclease Nob1
MKNYLTIFHFFNKFVAKLFNLIYLLQVCGKFVFIKKTIIIYLYYMGRIVTTESFITKSKLIHGENTFNYNQVNYIDNKTIVKIFCNKCQKIFEQTPNHHTKHGCKHCSLDKRIKNASGTLEHFIKRANEIHNFRYDYAKVKYVNSRTPVTITCKIHGDFDMKANSHYRHGCKKCSPNAKLTTDEFIEKSKLKYGDLYDYNKVQYNTNRDNVIIGCKIHGDFLQSPDTHLRDKGKGCPKCSGKKKLTTDEFIYRGNNKYDGKYDYSKSVYVNNSTNITIICPSHGEFEQTSSTHLRDTAKGCPKCCKQFQDTLETFIDKAKLKHGDLYDYTNVNYINSKTKVDIICEIHGIFSQKPSKHIMGHKCPHCSISKKDNLESFIAKAIKTHGLRYDYSKVNYIQTFQNVEIICKKHGSFFQTPHHHILSTGCPICGYELVAKYRQDDPNGWKHTSWELKSLKSKNFSGFKVYVIKCWNDDEIFYKIGKTYVDIKQRFANKTTMPYNYEVLKIYEGDAKQMSELEDDLQNHNKSYKYRPIIEFGGQYECFSKIIYL